MLIQVSATQGQTILLDEASKVPGKYAVIIPDRSRIVPEYLKLVLDMAMPEFLARYQTTINIQMAVFQRLRLDIHNGLDSQRAVAEVASMMDERIDGIAREVQKLKDFKAFHLDTMFC